MREQKSGSYLHCPPLTPTRREREFFNSLSGPKKCTIAGRVGFFAVRKTVAAGAGRMGVRSRLSDRLRRKTHGPGDLGQSFQEARF